MDMFRVFMTDNEGVLCDVDYDATSAEQAEALARIDYMDYTIHTDMTICVLEAYKG